MSVHDRVVRLAGRLTPDRDPSEGLTDAEFNWLSLQIHQTLIAATEAAGVPLPAWLLADGEALENVPLSPIPDAQMAEIRAWDTAHADPSYDDMTDAQILERLKVVSAEVASLQGRTFPT